MSRANDIATVEKTLQDLIASAVLVQGFLISLGDTQTAERVGEAVLSVVSSAAEYMQLTAGKDELSFRIGLAEKAAELAEEKRRMLQEAVEALRRLQGGDDGHVS